MMLGHLMEWFYSGLGGIYQADYSIGYRHIIIAPKPVGDINWSRCTFNSPAGQIVSDWEMEENSFKLEIEIPEISTAKIVIPDDFRNSAVEVVNLSTQEIVHMEIIKGAFLLKSGKYKIIASL